MLAGPERTPRGSVQARGSSAAVPSRCITLPTASSPALTGDLCNWTVRCSPTRTSQAATSGAARCVPLICHLPTSPATDLTYADLTGANLDAGGIIIGLAPDASAHRFVCLTEDCDLGRISVRADGFHPESPSSRFPHTPLARERLRPAGRHCSSDRAVGVPGRRHQRRNCDGGRLLPVSQATSVASPSSTRHSSALSSNLIMPIARDC